MERVLKMLNFGEVSSCLVRALSSFSAERRASRNATFISNGMADCGGCTEQSAESVNQDGGDGGDGDDGGEGGDGDPDSEPPRNRPRRAKKPNPSTASKSALAEFDTLPETAWVDLRVVAALSGRSPATVWRHSLIGLLPAPKRFGARCTRWNVGQLRAVLAA